MVENIVKKKGKIRIYNIYYDRTETFEYDWRCSYDGVDFIGGKFGMIEVSTGGVAVSPDELKATYGTSKVTLENCIDLIKKKLKLVNKSMTEVINSYIEKSVEDGDTKLIGICLISLLII